MNIDLVSLNSLLQRKPFLAKLIGPMCDLLSFAADHNTSFQNSEDQNLGHMEENFKKPVAQFLAQLLEQAAQQKADAAPPKCPVCARKLTRRAPLERTITTASGEIKVTRIRGWCAKCKEWHCPGDDALGVEKGYSPYVQEMAALFASKMPLSEASAVLERVTGIKLPPTTLDRVAKEAGQKAQQQRKKNDEQARLGGPLLSKQQIPAQAPGTLIIMMDAWNIRERDDFGSSAALRKKGMEPQRWHWVWTGTVFGLEQRVQKSDRAMITHRGYVATREGLDSFGEQLHAEAMRHGLGKAEKVVVMGDGAAWIWNMAKDRFKEAVQRVDLYHIKQHLWTVAKEKHTDQQEAAKWVRKMKNQLKRGQTGRMISTLEEAVKEMAEEKRQAMKKEVNYFKEHEKRMTYAEAEKSNEPCGTGAIESTCRQYQCRFKRPGQFWSQKGDEALLCLDTFWRNNRWTDLFPHSKKIDPSKN